MPAAVERTLILYEGAKPGVGDIEQILSAVKRADGIDLAGTRVTVSGPVTEPSTDLAMAIVAEMEGGELSPGALGRTIFHTASAGGARRVVVAVVKAPDAGRGRDRRDRPGRDGGMLRRRERNPWVRELIPEHLAKLDNAGVGLAWRPGWAWLSSEPALSFVASATDATIMELPNVQILVSLFSVTEPERIRKRMRGGYVTWLDHVAKAAGVRVGDALPDLAHWILCADHRLQVVHLGYLSAEANGALMPWDLLPPDEQQTVPRLG
jgi:hypothetical protein